MGKTARREKVASIVVSCLAVAFGTALFTMTCCLENSEGIEFSETGTRLVNKGGLGHSSDMSRAPIADRSGVMLVMDIVSPDGFSISRSYPYGSLAAYVLGFGTPWGKGVEGVEFVYESIIGNGPENRIFHLTISRDIQEQAERDLAWQIKRLEAKNGCTIVMEIESGQILAMAAAPAWNPASAWQQAATDMRNPALEDTTVPWLILPLMLQRDKTFKDISNKGISMKWNWSEPGENIALWSPWQTDITKEGILADDLPARLSALGFGQLTGIDLPGEKQGSMPANFPSSVAEAANSDFFGTPIQLLQAFAHILNNGQTAPIHIALSKENHTDNHVNQGAKTVTGVKDKMCRQYSEDMNVHEMRKMIKGTGSGPALAGIKIAKNSKTFKAQVTSMGFWPVNRPEVCYVTVLNDVRQDPRKKRGTLGRTIKVARNASIVTKQSGFAANISGTGKMTENQYHENKSANMPDLRGLSMREAAERLFRMGIKVSASGNGRVIRQIPSAGTKVANISECKLLCSIERDI